MSALGKSSADDQLLFRSHAAPAATAMALVSSVRCWAARAETSVAANAAVSPASNATAASATETNASASRRPSVSPRPARPGGPAGPGGLASSVIAGQAEALTAAHDGLDDPGIAWIVLDLALQLALILNNQHRRHRHTRLSVGHPAGTAVMRRRSPNSRTRSGPAAPAPTDRPPASIPSP